MGTNMALDLGVELDSLTAEDISFAFSDPLSENDGSVQTSRNSEKPYHIKRPHKKSRTGCKSCKRRKVKCNEAKPNCSNCVLRRETCVYPSVPTISSPAVSSSKAASVRGSTTPEQTPSSQQRRAKNAVVIQEPLFCPNRMDDAIDMKMLWFYTTETFNSFSIEGGRSKAIDYVLQVKIVEHAFQSPFLMQCLMGLSALQLQSLKQEIPYSKVVSYQSNAFQGYRDAIEQAKPADYPALLACSLLMCALSSQMFREHDTKPLYIVDWMAVWRGIGLIVEIITPQSIADSGLAVLFYRPPIDLEKCTQHIPKNLLFMVSSIRPGDSDYEHQQTYYAVLKYLGSLYMELQHGFSPILDLRVITFFTFIPREFIPLAKEHRPRTLIILAHYLCFAKLNNGLWWMQGIADREITEICKAIGDEWSHLLHVPRKILRTDDYTELAQAILDNYTWTPGEYLFEKNRNPSIKSLTMVTDEGREAKVVNGKWVLEAGGAFAQKLKAANPNADMTTTLEECNISKTPSPGKLSNFLSPADHVATAMSGAGNPLNSPSNMSSTLSPPLSSVRTPSDSATSGPG